MDTSTLSRSLPEEVASSKMDAEQPVHYGMLVENESSEHVLLTELVYLKDEFKTLEDRLKDSELKNELQAVEIHDLKKQLGLNSDDDLLSKTSSALRIDACSGVILRNSNNNSAGSIIKTSSSESTAKPAILHNQPSFDEDGRVKDANTPQIDQLLVNLLQRDEEIRQLKTSLAQLESEKAEAEKMTLDLMRATENCWLRRELRELIDRVPKKGLRKALDELAIDNDEPGHFASEPHCAEDIELLQDVKKTLTKEIEKPLQNSEIKV